MLPDDRFTLEIATRRLRSAARTRRARFTPPEWPRSRGPVPNPRRED